MKFARAPLQVCLPSPPPRVTARQGPPQTLVPPRATAVSLQGGLEAHMEETVRRVTPRTSLRSALRQQAVIKEGENSNIS